jgi:type I restriction enzyme R subunit
MTTRYTEDSLVEQPAIELLRDELGWGYVYCFEESFGDDGSLGRESSEDVVLVRELRFALKALNSWATDDDIDEAVEIITIDRRAMSIVSANREIYDLIRNGVEITSEEDGRRRRVQVIDFGTPENNRFILTSQLWVTSEIYRRRTDLVGFINGLPLVFIELKKGRVGEAFSGNLSDYKDTVPQLFRYNGFIILSNASESRIGSITSQWEHFGEWKKISSEGEEGIVSLETMLRGTCEKARLIDIIENFILFDEGKSGLSKLVPRNHQFIGVNQAIESVHNVRTNEGRLGVFWHTQGSGKSYSMVFFTEKVIRKVPGNWTFVVVTDRKELDEQIHGTYSTCGKVKKKEAHAESSKGLRKLLSEDHRYIFTLIHKFKPDADGTMPVLSERDDIIVITDEAHRSQYDLLALNMRKALPNASFIGFTGTPLMAGEEKTKQVFGDYISIYNFKQSIDDKATVPLYYENRIPELQLTNQDLNEDMENLLEEAELDEDQEKKLEREFSRQYHLVTREDRLEKIAEDMVAHYSERETFGKAMVVCIDKATAVKMYDKVRKYWDVMLSNEFDKLAKCDPLDRPDLAAKVKYLAELDMAVVVSQGQGEIAELKGKGLDILPHRTRMEKEDLATKFKDKNDNLRIVFVCAMWITGFDVPSCSTIYLDKPMRNHTLMQTIARANRVFPKKNNGLIVDYVGVFRNLQKALAIYADPGEKNKTDTPVKDKKELIEDLRGAMLVASQFCESIAIDLGAIEESEKFVTKRLLQDACEKVLTSEDAKKQFFHYAGRARKLYKAVLPDFRATEFARRSATLKAIAGEVKSVLPVPDISEVMQDIESLLDDSVSSEGYVIKDAPRIVDLSKIDFDALAEKFKKSDTKRADAEKLKGDIQQKLQSLVMLNRTRMDFLEKFQKMLEEYNQGAYNTEEFYKSLLDFARDLNEEEQRHHRLGLTEEELTIFDLLTKPDMTLSAKEEKEVKKVAKELLTKLKDQQLVLDWKKRQQTKAAVRNTIEEVLDSLPEVYDRKIYAQKCDKVYLHIYEQYQGEGKSIYAMM